MWIIIYELKKRLAAQYGSDHQGYTDAGTSFINALVARVRSACQSIEHNDEQSSSSLNPLLAGLSLLLAGGMYLNISFCLEDDG